jgi:hypothetical protein
MGLLIVGRGRESLRRRRRRRTARGGKEKDRVQEFKSSRGNKEQACLFVT